MIFAIIMQTSAAVWFAATLTSRVDVLERDQERQRLVDAGHTTAINLIERASVRQDERLANILEIVSRIERRLELMESN